MAGTRRFTATDSVADLINEDYDLLPVLSRLGMPLGFGSRSIESLCNEAGINVDAFLLITNYILSGDIDKELMSKVSAKDVVEFLRNSHDYYLSYKYPHIRANLLAALDPGHSDINPIIVKYLDDYILRGKAHFTYEEEKLFPYVESLTAGRPGKKLAPYSSDTFVRQHDHDIRDALSELKNIILRYYTTSVPYRMYDVLVDLFNCEADLRQHTEIEERILVPLITRLENHRHSHA